MPPNEPDLWGCGKSFFVSIQDNIEAILTFNNVAPTELLSHVEVNIYSKLHAHAVNNLLLYCRWSTSILLMIYSGTIYATCKTKRWIHWRLTNH